MDLFKAFATDTTAEIEGVIVEYGDAKLKIARRGNPAHQKLMTKLLKQNKIVLDSKGDAAEKAAKEIMARAISKTILLGWEGVEYKGKPLPYTQEKAYELLLAHNDFRDFVHEASDDMERFKVDKEDDDVKN